MLLPTNINERNAAINHGRIVLPTVSLFPGFSKYDSCCAKLDLCSHYYSVNTSSKGEASQKFTTSLPSYHGYKNVVQYSEAYFYMRFEKNLYNHFLAKNF